MCGFADVRIENGEALTGINWWGRDLWMDRWGDDHGRFRSITDDSGAGGMGNRQLAICNRQG